MMDTSKYITKIYSEKDKKFTKPLETLAEIDYSMGYMDFFFKKSDNIYSHVKKEWFIQTDVENAIKNGEKNLSEFKKRLNKNINNGLYLDEKCTKEINTFFSFMEEKIEKLKEYELTNIVCADLSEFTFMYNLESEMPIGENEIKQRSYLNNLIDGMFSEKLEAEEVSIAKKKINDLRDALLKQEKILYIEKKEDDIYKPKHYNLKEKLLLKFILDMTVSNKPLKDTDVHKKIIDDALKSVKIVFESRGFDFEIVENIPEELLEDGKIRIIVYGLQDPVNK